VFPVNAVKRVLEDNGLSDADLVHKAVVQKLAALFGADAVLYITINRWDARWILLSTTITVDLTYVLKMEKQGQSYGLIPVMYNTRLKGLHQETFSRI